MLIYPFVVVWFGFVRFVLEIRTQAGIPMDKITAGIPFPSEAFSGPHLSKHH
jgi:hypothetical protein